MEALLNEAHKIIQYFGTVELDSMDLHRRAMQWLKDYEAHNESSQEVCPDCKTSDRLIHTVYCSRCGEKFIAEAKGEG